MAFPKPNQQRGLRVFDGRICRGVTTAPRTSLTWKPTTRNRSSARTMRRLAELCGKMPRNAGTADERCISVEYQLIILANSYNSYREFPSTL